MKEEVRRRRRNYVAEPSKLIALPSEVVVTDIHVAHDIPTAHQRPPSSHKRRGGGGK